MRWTTALTLCCSRRRGALEAQEQPLCSAGQLRGAAQQRVGSSRDWLKQKVTCHQGLTPPADPARGADRAGWRPCCCPSCCQGDWTPPSGSQPLSRGSGTSSLRRASSPCLDRRYAPPGAALAAEVDTCPLMSTRACRRCSQPSSLPEEALLRALLREPLEALLATYATSSPMPDGSELSNRSER